MGYDHWYKQRQDKLRMYKGTEEGYKDVAQQRKSRDGLESSQNQLSLEQQE